MFAVTVANREDDFISKRGKSGHIFLIRGPISFSFEKTLKRNLLKRSFLVELFFYLEIFVTPRSIQDPSMIFKILV